MFKHLQNISMKKLSIQGIKRKGRKNKRGGGWGEERKRKEIRKNLKQPVHGCHLLNFVQFCPDGASNVTIRDISGIDRN